MPTTGAKRRRAGGLGLLALAVIILAVPATAQTDLRPYAPGTPQFGIDGRPDAPAPTVLPSDEDWSGLAGQGSAKWIDLGTVALSFGFDGRIGIERHDDRSFGDMPGHDTTLHLRDPPCRADLRRPRPPFRRTGVRAGGG